MLSLKKKIKSSILKLSLSSDEGGTIDFPLNKTKLLVGSFEHADIRLDHPSVSKYHAFIFMDDHGGLSVLDLQSENGIIVNNKKYTQTPFHEGDSLIIGCFNLNVVEDKSDLTSVEKVDSSILTIATAVDDAYDVSLDPLFSPVDKGLILIDGEYCDIKFSENHFNAISSDPYKLISKEKDLREYIYDEDKIIPQVINTDHLEQDCLEVAVMSGDSILDVSHYALTDGSYFFTGKKRTKNRIYLDILDKTEEHEAIIISNKTVRVSSFSKFSVAYIEDDHSIDYNSLDNISFHLQNCEESLSFGELKQKLDKNEVGHTDLISTDNRANWIKIFEHPAFERRNDENLRSLPKKDLVLEHGGIVRLNYKTVQILIRITKGQPHLKTAPFFSKDKEIRNQLISFLSIGLLMLLISFFVDTNPTKPEEQIAIVYKRPMPFKDAPQIKAKEVAEVKADNPENIKPDTSATREKTKTAESKKPAKESTRKNEIAKRSESKKASKSKAQAKVKKAKAKVDTYKFQFKSTVSSLLAKTGDLSDVKVTNVSSESSKSVSNIATSGSQALKKANLDAYAGKLGKKSSSKSLNRVGAKGLVNRKGAFTSYIEPKTVVLGSIDPELLRKILRQYLPQFRHCYQQELEYNSDNLQGVVDLDFRINNIGKVTKTNIIAKNAKFSKRGTACMSSVLKIIQFPKPKGGGVVDVRQPLNFYSEK